MARLTLEADLFATVGEVLVWLVALEDLLVSVDVSYWTERAADSDGAMLAGIRYARNAVVHGESVITAIHFHGGAMLGASALGTFALGEPPSISWSPRAAIGFAPKASQHVAEQERSYDRELADAHVLGPLNGALAFLRHAAGT